MSYFASAFTAIAQDPDGEALVPRVSLRLKDNTLIEVTDTEKAVELSDIMVKREREYGVVQSQDWGATFTNSTLALLGYDLYGCWIVLEGGFPVADEWAVLAQGKINKSSFDTSLKYTVAAKDTLRSLLEKSIEQNYSFTDTGWGGSIEAVSIDDDSKNYDNEWDSTETYIGVAPGADVSSAQDGFYIIEFTSATVYKVTHPDLTVNTGLSIASDETVDDGADEVFEIKAAGWDTATDAYATGDLFRFPASSAWTTADLNPMNIIYTLLKDSQFLGLEHFDVLTGAAYSSPLYDDAGKWTSALTRYTTTAVRGEIPAGTDYISIIQKLLKLIHCNLYTMPNGQIALSEFLPTDTDATHFNGDFDVGDVDIISAGVVDDTDWLANVITFRYQTLSTGAEASYTAEDATSISTYGRIHREIDLRPFRIDGVSVKTYCDQLLARKKENRKTFSLETILSGGVIGMDDPIAITESFLALVSEQCMVSETLLNIDSNTAELSAFIEDILFEDYAQIGDATTTPVGATAGGTLKVL